MSRPERALTRPRRPSFLVLTLAAALHSCEPESPPGEPTRETLPNGAVLARYPGLPAIDSVGPEVTEAHVDLQFGSLEGEDPNFAFGDIRGICQWPPKNAHLWPLKNAHFSGAAAEGA